MDIPSIVLTYQVNSGSTHCVHANVDPAGGLSRTCRSDLMATAGFSRYAFGLRLLLGDSTERLHFRDEVAGSSEERVDVLIDGPIAVIGLFAEFREVVQEASILT